MMESHPKWLKDELDRKIIRELQRNARESTTNIGTLFQASRQEARALVTVERFMPVRPFDRMDSVRPLALVRADNYK